MVLTERQKGDLHSAIYEYLLSKKDNENFAKAAAAMKEADPESCTKEPLEAGKTPLLEKKWTAIPRLQRKVLELERSAAQSAKIHAHRTGTAAAGGDTKGGDNRRMLPRLPCAHTLQGHAAVVTCVKVHPVFTVAVSGSEDGTIKVGTSMVYHMQSIVLLCKECEKWISLYFYISSACLLFYWTRLIFV